MWLFLANKVMGDYYVRYQITITARGYEVLTKDLSEYEYERDWKKIAPYDFNDNIQDEYCEVPATIKIRKLIR
jgi:predicted alpha/beta hydrolase